MSALISALDSALVDSLWQDLAIALLLSIVLTLLRNRPKAAYAATCLALLGMCTLPVVSGISAFHRARAATATVVLSRVLFVRAADPSLNWVASARHWLVTAWICGVLLFSVRAMLSQCFVMKL